MLPPTAGASKAISGFPSQELLYVDVLKLLPDFFTVWCVLVFIGPLVKSVQYAQDINVLYWLGELPVFASLLALVLICIGAVIHWLSQVPSKVAIMISIVGASLALAVTADGIVVKSFDLRNVFASTDCRWSEEKYEVEKAWRTAFVFFQDCQSAAVNRTTQHRTIVDCPGYSAMLTKYSKTWSYLADLEETYTCAGWCSPSTPVWDAGDAIRDPCSKVVAEVLSAKVIPFAKQVTIFGIFKASLTVMFVVLMGGSMRSQGARW